MIRATILIHRIESTNYTKKDGTTGTNHTAICTYYDDGEETTVPLKIFGKTLEKVECGSTYNAGIRLRGNEWNGKYYPELTIIFVDKIRAMDTKNGESGEVSENTQYADSPTQNQNTSSAPASNPFIVDEKDDLPF